ncbi:carboxypeptidase-like regulatory domain-containing protein [Ramlibacter sp. WS9]|uniref:carboxypeptidase-like regulatory domain-containing protein n=1 Tax=Ramlibacter sp. WS9 TaxID=1882741 RepID=UPI001170020B|nr:carboxypeptidase-like regulatory domain-containing protein [Ramlibacter sp. WS9]ROZ76070.1 carboxypeptidase regulatory-like domain-containing protein [Ramlibacter sp. WS9]
MLLLLALMLPLQACGLAYSAKPIEGWVVDAATKQPLEGVNVVAHWVVNFGMEGGQGTDLMLMETVTDRNGRYAFPGWGPTQLPVGRPWEARMKSQSPELIFYKKDYWWNAVSNETKGPQPGPGPLVRTSDWNGKTFELKKFEDTLDRYGSVVSGVLTSVSWGSNCRWKQIPRMLVALDRESARLWQQKIFNDLPTIQRVENASVREACGSVKDFFAEYLK